MPHIAVVIIKVLFEVEEEEWGGGVNRITSDEVERNLVHILTFLTIPIVPLMNPNHPLHALLLDPS